MQTIRVNWVAMKKCFSDQTTERTHPPQSMSKRIKILGVEIDLIAMRIDDYQRWKRRKTRIVAQRGGIGDYVLDNVVQPR